MSLFLVFLIVVHNLERIVFWFVSNFIYQVVGMAVENCIYFCVYDDRCIDFWISLCVFVVLHLILVQVFPYLLTIMSHVAGLYLHAVTETKLVVDTSRGETLRINVMSSEFLDSMFPIFNLFALSLFKFLLQLCRPIKWKRSVVQTPGSLYY